VEVLRPRPLRCYKCLAAGHTRAKCPVGSADRSQLCFRCGLVGHKARGCTGPDHCPVCASRGLAANHRAGSFACPPVYAGAARFRGPARPTSGAQAPQTPGLESSGDPHGKTSASPPKKRKRRPKSDSPITGTALGDLPRSALRDPPGRDGTAPRGLRVRMHVAPLGMGCLPGGRPLWTFPLDTSLSSRQRVGRRGPRSSAQGLVCGRAGHTNVVLSGTTPLSGGSRGENSHHRDPLPRVEARCVSWGEVLGRWWGGSSGVFGAPSPRQGFSLTMAHHLVVVSGLLIRWMPFAKLQVRGMLLLRSKSAPR